MVLTSIEDKAAKASKSIMAPIATARAESKKRKAAGAPKAPTKRRRALKISKAASAGSNERVAENTPVDAGDAQAEAKDAHTETSGTGGGANFIASVLQAVSADDILGAPEVEPMPSMFGPGVDPSSSKDEEVAADDGITSSSSKSTSRGRT